MKRKFKLLCTSDIHATVLATRYSDGQMMPMGLAKIASLFEKMKDENTLCIDNGDLIQGSPLASYFNRVHPQEISPATQAVKRIPYDYLNLGNHDFNFGVEALQRHLDYVGVDLLTNNVQLGEKREPLYRIHQFPNGVKIALFGIVTDFITRWEKKENLVNVQIDSAFEKAAEAVAEIRKQETVDAIVGVYHGGFEKDLTTGKATEKQTGENCGYRLCEELGLDILVTGHQHRSLAEQCCGTLVVQTAQNGSEVAMIEFDADSKVGTVSLLPVTEVENSAIVQDVKGIEKEFQQWLDQPLGETDKDLKVTNQFEARLKKHPVVSFMNQVQLDKTQADFSAVALFNEAVGFKKEITMRDIVSTYVYSNTLTVVEISGKELKNFLEQCAEYFSLNEKGDIVVSDLFLYPKPMHFDYDMVDGLDYTIVVSNPIGHRIKEMKKEGQLLDLDKAYTLVVSNYRASGGGNFEMITDGKVVAEYQDDMVDILAQYILEHPKVIVNHRDNITVKKNSD
ncbi:MAG: bifunctional metallophosphatase/5'-nucleotidase [Anaerorhabdus sp.]